MIKYQEDEDDSGKWYLAADADTPWHDSAVVITLDDPIITIDALKELWEMDLEGANYHSMISIPENLIAVCRQTGVSDDQIKRILWQILEHQSAWM